MSAADYVAMARSHLDKAIQGGTAPYCRMWMSSLDIRTGTYFQEADRPRPIKKRVYRSIDAPGGCTLYWDMPAVTAAHALSHATKDGRYADAADAYVRAFLDRCVAHNGVFLWGNHYYYDAIRDAMVYFTGVVKPSPCDMATEDGHLHEARPISPDWESIWRVSPDTTERCIRQIGERHVFDRRTGGFNRHADGKKGCAFLEAGGILVESLCWLAAKTGDRSLTDLALCIARFSWNHRDPETGLVENNPTVTRWDKLVGTTEIGLWAGCLLRAADLVHVEEFEHMAIPAVSSYLRYGYDEDSGRYDGRVFVRDGSPDLTEKSTAYQPGRYADIWEPLFPTHDYPLILARTCVDLFKRTRRGEFEEGARRWAEVVRRDLPARGGVGAYAEHYGRCIDFLLDAAETLNDRKFRDLAQAVADEAVAKLYAHGMFRGHPGEDRCDAVDGVGFLLLALMRLLSFRNLDQ